MLTNDELREIARDALEAARVEVVRRLGEHGLPTSVAGQRLLVLDNDELTGWESEWEAVRRSSLTVPAVVARLHDGSVNSRRIGLREHLEPFARALASATPAGRVRATGTLASRIALRMQ